MLNPSVSVPPMSHRRSMLNNAADHVDGDRNVHYGDPIDDFRRTADFWGIYIQGILRRYAHENEIIVDDYIYETLSGLLQPHDVAIMMNLLKVSRLTWSPDKADHWEDGAGYLACGWDCIVREYNV